jgi:hypothetical protein
MLGYIAAAAAATAVSVAVVAPGVYVATARRAATAIGWYSSSERTSATLYCYELGGQLRCGRLTFSGFGHAWIAVSSSSTSGVVPSAGYSTFTGVLQRTAFDHALFRGYEDTAVHGVTIELRKLPHSTFFPA